MRMRSRSNCHLGADHWDLQPADHKWVGIPCFDRAIALMDTWTAPLEAAVRGILVFGGSRRLIYSANAFFEHWIAPALFTLAASAYKLVRRRNLQTATPQGKVCSAGRKNRPCTRVSTRAKADLNLNRVSLPRQGEDYGASDS